MNKKLIEKMMKEIEYCDDYMGFDVNVYDLQLIEQILTKHLSDKVIVEKKVLEEMINGYKNAYSKGIIFIRPIDISYKLQSLLDNQE